MDPQSRVPSDATPPSRRAISPPFCRVERSQPGGRKHTYVVHTGSPTFLVEFESAARADSEPPDGPESKPVIRRVCVPNNWAGDYARCARLLGAAADFFSATEPSGE
jgi:hypothetical protein